MAPYQAATLPPAHRASWSPFSSWNGTKVHAHRYLLTDAVLKGELGFQGFLISDWQAIDQIPGDYAANVTTAINAGLDMIMVPYDYQRFISTLTAAVESGAVPLERIDDAVRRILRVKLALGLFEHPYADPSLIDQIGSAAHRALAREAVRKSLVLLKNENQRLPLAKETLLIFVAGTAANDIGIQSGGWTIEWQGKTGKITPGATILEGIQQAVSAETRVEYSSSGNFANVTDAQGHRSRPTSALPSSASAPMPNIAGQQHPGAVSAPMWQRYRVYRLRANMVMIIISGRPLIITEQLAQVDAVVAAWLPGSEGQGVADVLFGDYPFTGKLPYTWPRTVQQLPFDFATLPAEGSDAPLFPFGYGYSP
ncbi:MAG: glycoside hydrolase family 3 C-terminal domain-containing protein [Caldilineaceae bacterium]